MSDPEFSDALRDYLSAAIDAVTAGADAPSPQNLSDTEAALAEQLLADVRRIEPGEFDEIPYAEDPIAVQLGLVAPPPNVLINATVVAAALQSRDRAEIEQRLSNYGHLVDDGMLDGLASGAISEVPPHLLRTLAAAMDVEPGELASNNIEPYPVKHVDALAAMIDAPWHIEVHENEVHLASTEHRLGVLLAHVGHSEALDALNIRRAAWELLTTRWIRHSACVVMASAQDDASIVIDAIDCQPHHHAPTGVLTYGPAPTPAPVRDALRSYAGRFAVTWTPPPPFGGDSLNEGLVPGHATSGIDAALSGRFSEPKLSAFRDVRAMLSQQPPKVWERWLADLGEPDDPDAIDAALEALTEQ